MLKKIPIGISDFKEIIKDNYYYIDKSLFIKDIIEDGSKVILIPRPRRFGKTLNMSLLKYFFDITENDNGNLFRGLKIEEHKGIMENQGKYPVIFLTFKDVHEDSFNFCLEKIMNVVSLEYGRFRFLLESDVLGEDEKNYYRKILFKQGSQIDYELSLYNLTRFLRNFYGNKVIILIDEYDVPIQEGYFQDYYDKITKFMRNFLSAGLKDNQHLQKAVLTGILRVAKESIFSGLNNLEVCSLLNNQYSEYFGFLEWEVKEICKYYEVSHAIDDIKKWYDGYVFGNNVIYNPWSILNYVKNHDSGFKPYWVNTAENSLIKMLLAKGNEELKKELESLIRGEELIKPINENIVMSEVDNNTSNVWSFLLFSGYLKAEYQELKEGITYCSLKLPNMEVKVLYNQLVLSWFQDNAGGHKYTLMLNSLISGDLETFEDILSEFVIKTASYFDIDKESEKFYHAFVLGILISLSDKYEIKSNRESGFGRYDIMMIPKDKSCKGIIIEFKKVNERRKETLESAVELALKQIKDKKYGQELIKMGVDNISEIAIAFQGKEVLVKASDK